MVDNKGQCVGTRTTVGISIVERINAGSSIGGTGPCVVVTDCFGIAVVGAGVNSQVEGNDAVTTDGIEN